MNTRYKQKICLNGHQISDRSPLDSETHEFCEECGAKVIDSCPHCEEIIEGYLSIDGVFDLSSYTSPIPKYCKNCGTPYPWTETALNSLNELIELSELNEKDKEALKSSSADLLTENPRSKIAVLKWKTIGKSLLNLAHDIIVDIASESVVKMMYGN